METDRSGVALTLVAVLLFGMLFGLSSASAQGGGTGFIEVLDTQVNPATGNTYHLLSSGSWSASQSVAEDMGGNLVTVNDPAENDWLLEKFSADGIHLWIGLSLVNDNWQWANGEESYWSGWGLDQPSEDDDEKFAHIIGTEVGSFEVGEWNNIDDDPDYFTIYGIVEIDGQVDHMLAFDGEDDWVEVHSTGNLDDISDELSISAWIYPHDTSGIQTIMMKGDHGWGMEIIDGKLAYASGYSIADHPTSTNLSVISEQWNFVAISVVANGSVELSVGNETEIALEVGATIPLGDFGSNECISDPYECKQLVIGRHGMGYDGYYFSGIIEDVRISAEAANMTNQSIHVVTIISEWNFNEGHGEWTWDGIQNNRSGMLHGEPQWLEPDGTPVTMAIPLENGVMIEDIPLDDGESMLFYVDLPDYVTYISITAETGRGGNPDLFISHQWVPGEDDFDYEGWGWQNWANWFYDMPNQGRWYIMLYADRGSEHFSINAEWYEAIPPPPKSEMTELHDGIAVTDLSADYGAALYFYTEFEGDLHALSIESWGGKGDPDMISQYDKAPIIGNYWKFGDDDIDGIFGPDGSTGQGGQVGEEGGEEGRNRRYSYGPSTDELIRYINPQPGTWFIALYAADDFEDAVIRVSYEYPPVNTEPESAVELFDGEENGPWDSSDDIDQYHFYIEVPEDTPFLTVSIEGDWGDADIYLRHEDFASQENNDQSTRGTWGVWDSLTVNDPAVGKWYIMLQGDDLFRMVWITAAFKQGDFWIDEENRIELYANTPVNHLQINGGQTLLFFIEVPDSLDHIIIEIRGEGDRNGDTYLEVWSEYGLSWESEGEGRINELKIGQPIAGIYDIDLSSENRIEGVTIEVKFPAVDGDGDGTATNQPDWDLCTELSVQVFRQMDYDRNNEITFEEWKLSINPSDSSNSPDEPSFTDVDRNGDDRLELEEVENMVCTCGNELDLARFQLVDDNYLVSDDKFSSYPWFNQFDFEAFDADDDGFLDSVEYRDMRNACKTTWDSFDRDGDGVDNADDAFPDDASEQFDSDGDGIGDNSDSLKGVNNDLAYAAAGGLGLLLLVLIPLILVMLRGGKPEFSYSDGDDVTEQTTGNLALAEGGSKDLAPIGSSADSMAVENSAVGSDPTSDSDSDRLPESMTVADLGFPAEAVITTSSTVAVGYVGEETMPDIDIDDLVGDMAEDKEDNGNVNAPDSALMGSLSGDGSEVLEWPSGSGNNWTREQIGQDWRESR
ncbi:MAG TPA: hypothetical protein EYO42_01750 [Candidatus Poseidoniales archaeon]|nr:hypothetical protein [Candidatus Poseidoniales archaeon]